MPNLCFLWSLTNSQKEELPSPNNLSLRKQPFAACDTSKRRPSRRNQKPKDRMQALEQQKREENASKPTTADTMSSLSPNAVVGLLVVYTPRQGKFDTVSLPRCLQISACSHLIAVQTYPEKRSGCGWDHRTRDSCLYSTRREKAAGS